MVRKGDCSLEHLDDVILFQPDHYLGSLKWQFLLMIFQQSHLTGWLKLRTPWVNLN